MTTETPPAEQLATPSPTAKRRTWLIAAAAAVAAVLALAVGAAYLAAHGLGHHPSTLERTDPDGYVACQSQAAAIDADSLNGKLVNAEDAARHAQLSNHPAISAAVTSIGPGFPDLADAKVLRAACVELGHPMPPLSSDS